MEPQRRTGARHGLLVLSLLALGGAWPLVSLGSQTNAHTWILSAAAVSLGAVLGFWLWSRGIRLCRSKLGIRRPRLWLAAALVLAISVGATPAAVRMIYSAALEGIVCAMVVLAVRTRLHTGSGQPHGDRPWQ